MSLKSVRTLTAAQIAKKWNLPLKTVMGLIDDGAKVEKEHDKNIADAKQIARDHLSERPDYYKKLHKLEKSKVSMKEPDNKLSSGEVARGIYENIKFSTSHKVVHRDTKKIIAQGTKKEMMKKMKALNAKNPGSHFLGNAPSKKVGDTFSEGYASIGHSFDWAGDVNRRAKFYGKKPKPTTTKGDEKDDTYKDSKQGGKVKFTKAVRKEDIADKDWDDTTGKKLPESNHKHIHINKPDTKKEPGAEGTTHTIYEERKMDTKDHINEALDNILDENLSEMKENLLAALQEKAMEKLEEKKKEIAANYFAQ